jgi:peptide/nickel transport system substrate-binding protein
VDVAEGLGPEEIAALGGDPNVQVASQRSSLQLFIDMNNKKAPFDNVLVRRAMNHAIPRESIVDNVYKGLANPWQGISSSIYPGYKKFDEYDFDLEAAKALLAEAGYADGFTIPFSFTSGDPAQEQIGVILRDTFAQIGVKLKLQKLPPAAHADLVQSGKADFAMVSDAPLHPDPSFGLALWFTKDSCCNWQNYENPEVDRMLAECKSIVDLEERLACHEPVQEIIYSDSSQIWVAEPEFVIGLSKRVKGWGWNPNQYYSVAQMSLE